jgi:hypothetical protein
VPTKKFGVAVWAIPPMESLEDAVVGGKAEREHGGPTHVLFKDQRNGAGPE